METHIKVVAWLYLVFGALGVFGGLIVFLFFGGIAGLAGASGDPEAGAAGALLVGLGGLVFAFIFAVSVPSLAAGWGLLKFAPWARILTIILSVLNLWAFPIGTALGIYGLWALLNAQGAALFARR